MLSGASNAQQTFLSSSPFYSTTCFLPPSLKSARSSFLSSLSNQAISFVVISISPCMSANLVGIAFDF